ncbi:MAG: HAD family phosphatase, partial [Parcubacteria group bacterium]
GFFAKKIDFITGFKEFISQNNNLPAAVATALKLKYLDIVDNQVGLKKMFGGHVYSIYEIGDRSKPHPDIFLHAAQKLEIDPGECLVFEDAPNGIEAARRAGMRSVALTTTYPRQDLKGATVVVDCYEEVDLEKI